MEAVTNNGMMKSSGDELSRVETNTLEAGRVFESTEIAIDVQDSSVNVDRKWPLQGIDHSVLHGLEHDEVRGYPNFAYQLTANLLEFGVAFHSVFTGLTLGYHRQSGYPCNCPGLPSNA